MNENTTIAAYYFQKCWEIFNNEVVKPQLNVVDYWWRFKSCRPHGPVSFRRTGF